MITVLNNLFLTKSERFLLWAVIRMLITETFGLLIVIKMAKLLFHTTSKQFLFYIPQALGEYRTRDSDS